MRPFWSLKNATRLSCGGQSRFDEHNAIPEKIKPLKISQVFD
jgi:hypothetical protein